DLTTQYKPGSDNKEIIRGLLFKAMSQKKVLTTREVGDTPEEYAPHPWIARGITLIDYLDNEEYILKGTSGYADLSTLHTPSDLMVETVVPDVYSYFANDPLGKNIPREVIEAGIVPTGMGGLTFGFTSPEGETQLKAITADIEKLVDEKINSKQRTFVIRDIGPGDGSELVSILGQLNAVIGKNDPGEKWEVVIDVADNNESILAEAEETIRAEMAGFENITCNVRYSKVDVFDAAGLNALRTTGAAGNTDYIIFRNVLNIKQHIDRGDFELKDMAASFIALRNLIENFAGEDTKLVIEPYPIQPQNGLLANGILDAGVIKSFQEDNGFSNFLNLFGASDMMPVGISAPSPVEELPEARTDGKGMSRRRFLEGVGAIALTAAMDTAALDVESFLAEATPEELAEKLLTRDRINEESFEKMTNEYEYLTQAFSKINFSEFSRHKPSEKEIKFLAGLIKHCQEVDPEKLNKLLGAVENVIIIENGPHEGGAGFGVFSNNSVVLEFDSDLPTLSEVSTPIYAGLLIHEAAHVEGARKEVPITGILSEIYARLEVLDWKGVGANPQSWIDEEQYMVDMITLGIEEVKAEKSIAGKNVTRHDMEDSEAGKVWDYYWANGVTRMEAVRFMGAARGLLMTEGYADSEVKYISGTGKLRPDTKEREKGQPVKGYWIAFDLGGGKTAEIFSGVDEKDGLCVFYDGEWTKLSFKLEEAKAKMGRGFDGIGELTVAASAKWHKGMKDEAEKREALSPSLDLEELTAALDTNPAMDVREFHKATDSFISTRSNGLYDLFNNSDQDIRRAELERIVRRKYAGKYMGEIPAHILKDKNGKDVVSREGDKILVVARGMLKPFSLFARVENEKPLPGLSVIWVDNAFYGKEELENLILSGNPAERSEDVLGGLYRTLPDSLKNEIGQARINRIFDRIHTAAQTHLNEYYSMRAHPDVAAPKKEKERELPILTVKVNSDGKLAFAQGWMNT
ncbi:MAG TPA: hypothetical protein PKZ41_02640, partial [Candidatus Omnitrophota bacterium]|nr:hypothetical protein [Candidatus Omnitrophota bacterium]